MDRETSEYANEEYKKVIIMENNTFMMPPIVVPFFRVNLRHENSRILYGKVPYV